MADYDIVMMGHVSNDIMIFYDGSRQDFLGGPVIYSSASASAAGAKVLIVTKASFEDTPKLDYLRDESVELVVVPSGNSTSIKNVYHTKDQERRSTTLLSQAEYFSLADVPSEKAAIYHLAGLFYGEIPSEMIVPLSKRAAVAIDAQGLLRCSVDGEMLYRDWAEKRELLPYITYLKTDAAEAEILTGTDDREKAARLLADWGAKEVMVTHHTEVIVLVDGIIHRAPFNPENLSGRTGRGDTCFASYLARRLKYGPEESVKFAAALTSMKMEKPGRFSGSEKEVIDRIG